MSATLLLITGSLLLLLGPRVGRSRPLPVDSSRQTGPAPWDELLGRMRAVGGSRRAVAQRIDLERWPALIQQMAALLRAGIEPAAVWAALREQGGVDRLLISHPHFYSAMVEWSEALGDVPILLHEADSPPQRLAAAITRGVQSHPGRGVTIKHLACNNQETNRLNSNSRVSPRALRDLYLRAFEICVRQARPAAVMTSYNLINGVHTSESAQLLEVILVVELLGPEVAVGHGLGSGVAVPRGHGVLLPAISSACSTISRSR